MSNGSVKSTEIKACESGGARRTYGYTAVTRGDRSAGIGPFYGTIEVDGI